MKHISEIYLSDRLDNFKISMIIMKFYLHYTLSQSLLDTQVNVHQVLVITSFKLVCYLKFLVFFIIIHLAEERPQNQFKRSSNNTL